ncbi:MAG TPA: hypothetical protein VMF08_07150 [Candidatus Sulfotelmatobacter sp.]|nr:hypothetical protein [Candidatus Sulfotelmatobacter sp.]
MRERLVEDWLTRINERGYESSFCQTLISQGYRICRCGHSPIEHGKDVLAISPEGAVCAYQLKTGDFGQSDFARCRDQIITLVETLPTHPSLPAQYEYKPYFVTTGEFKDPAVSLVNEYNTSWQKRNLPTLHLISGRHLLADFIRLSLDFWPVEAPDVRRFRELYLVDGRGDFDIEQFARFITEILRDIKSGLDLKRRVAAANLFSSYLLGDFYKQNDHWSVLQGWTVCAAQIAWAGLSGNHPVANWVDSCKIAQNAAFAALESLAKEVLTEKAFAVKDRELDEFVRTRNTVAISAAACWQLISNRHNPQTTDFQSTVHLLEDYLKRGRLYFWGEGALSQFLIFFWMLEQGGKRATACSLLLDWIKAVTQKNARLSENPIDDPYNSPDECLAKMIGKLLPGDPSRPQAVESYSLFPSILLAVRRNLREQLNIIWKPITNVSLAMFRPEAPEDALLWHCKKGKEYAEGFARPQSWIELRKMAFKDDRERVPKVLQDDVDFALLYSLVFQHRILRSLIKFLDDEFGKNIQRNDT